MKKVIMISGVSFLIGLIGLKTYQYKKVIPIREKFPLGLKVLSSIKGKEKS